MKTCKFCKSPDLHDAAIKCPHCGEWLTAGSFIRKMVRLTALAFLMVFVLLLGSCALMAGYFELW
jgi:hypothetical protein